MPAFSTNSYTSKEAESADQFSGSLGHVLKTENGKTAVIGQAWMAQPGTLVTCGHVVEPFLKQASMLIVKFPASGNEYKIDSIKIHPSFVRQQDELINFDAAVLSLRLKEPELSAPPLPIKFDVSLRNQQTLLAVRYPAHLGSLSSSSDALSQTGHFLGHLRKHDNFHLLHDLALAPGDSGAPILNEGGVVAIHCGDTASLPGLNLPTTSIRLALWIDALRELGLSETAPVVTAQERRLSPLECGYIVLIAFLISFSVAMLDFVAWRNWRYTHTAQVSTSNQHR